MNKDTGFNLFCQYHLYKSTLIAERNIIDVTIVNMIEGEIYMQEHKPPVFGRADSIIDEMNKCADYLYAAPCCYYRYMIWSRLKQKIKELKHQSRMLQRDQLQHLRNPEMLTLEQLARYDGRNGNPAYVAVNGIIYDVTNNATWAAATHFGLSAGRDLTKEFAACHSGSPILSKLKVVGKVVT